MNETTAARMTELAGLEQRNPGVLNADRLRPAWLALVGLLFVTSLVAGFAALDVSWARFFSGFGELRRLVGLMFPPEVGNMARLWMWVNSLGESLAIAFLGTLAAALLAFPVSLLAARNVMPVWLARFSIRRGLDTVRGVNTLIWALIWINVVGLGPFAGVLAIMTTDFGTFGKLFSEALEATDHKAGEGVVASGGSPLHRIRFGLIPQVMPVLLSQILYLMESNVRSATIIGIVGAGGIGQHLSEAMRTLEWQQVSALVIMILVTVAIIDFASARIRFGIIGQSASDVSKQ